MSSEPLGDFVRRIRREKKLSLADVSKQSARKGQQRIAASYVCRIENEPKRKVSTERLKALADGLGVPVDELLARSVGLMRHGDDVAELRLLTRFRNLSPERQTDVLQIIELWN